MKSEGDAIGLGKTDEIRKTPTDVTRLDASFAPGKSIDHFFTLKPDFSILCLKVGSLRFLGPFPVF